MDLAGVAALDHEPDLRPRLLSDEVVMHRRHEQQGRDRRERFVRVTIREDDDLRPLVDRLTDAVPHAIERSAQAFAAFGDGEEAVDGERLEARLVAVLVDVQQLGQIAVRQDR